MITRRALLRGALAAGTLMASGLSLEQRAEAAPLDKRALLYDLQLGSFQTEHAARNLLEKVRKDTDIGRFAQVVQAGGQYKLILDINAPATHADLIAAKARELSPDLFKFLTTAYYNETSTEGRFANLLVENRIKETILKYTTAYTQGEIDQTAGAIFAHCRAQGLFGRDGVPPRGAIVPIPIRWLKTPYRTGMVAGRDYHAVELARGQTLLDIAKTMPGEARNNVNVLFKFNGIKARWQLNALPEGTPIMVPHAIVGDPIEPVVITENGPEADYKIVPASTPSGEIQRALQEDIPEIKSSIDAYLHSQKLGVLAQADMPAVLTESFNIQNFGQRRFYSDEANIRGLAESYGRGILEYRRQHNPRLRKVFVDHGHGEKDPGARHAASGMEERDFTKRIQHHLVQYLQSHGLEAHALNYTGKPSPTARIRYYAAEANRMGDPADSAYVSVHIDSMDDGNAPPPRIFVNLGRQPKSKALARSMLEQAVPFYERSRR